MSFVDKHMFQHSFHETHTVANKLIGKLLEHVNKVHEDRSLSSRYRVQDSSTIIDLGEHLAP
jgi:hypothetical protein